MTRSELIQDSTIDSLMNAYRIYKEKGWKYGDRFYNFTLYNYKGYGIDLECSHNGLYIWPTDEEHDDNLIFSIGFFKSFDISVQSVLDDYEFVINPGVAIEITIGEHIDVNNSTVYVHDDRDVEELLENYPEEWFFQQLTVQNIIPFKQFKEEVHFCKKMQSLNIDNYDSIAIYDLEKFNINMLEGFGEL